MLKNTITYLSLALLMLAEPTLAQKNDLPGYPDRSSSMDVLPGFINPPKGYGEVPFYWWQGDSLIRERLLWQMDQLAGKSISSLQINYSHLDSGGISYGLSRPSQPPVFSNEWWDLFKWFSAEARKRDMTVSLSDYTLGIGQGFFMDEAIEKNPDLIGSMLKHTSDTLTGKGKLKIPDNILTINAIRLNPDNSLLTDSRTSILSQVKDGSLTYDFGNEKWLVTMVFPEALVPSYDPMHPQSGKAYNQYFFQKFEDALPEKGNEALNFFFSDELNFRVTGNLWNSYFEDEFKKRKGYDVVPYLDALYTDIGPITTKIRLDYNDVIVCLSEENFFRPVYQWHQDRGMIFGCDHGGRGRDVAEFGDYFRTQRWNQGPGSDQPQVSKDIIKAKVAASIAHLYDRPRVWLEGFHSSGWGTSSADVTEAILANYVAGYNLLSFHGLYYSTMGGWWEWAPPDNHFRMPYWEQIDPLMKCTERLSYLLSQGHHRCDVAIIYPTEPVVAGMEGEKSVKMAFGTGETLYDKGIDFDFIDFESIARSEIINSELHVSGEKYKVIVVPSMRAIRHSSLTKLKEFSEAGGIIVNIGFVPEATEKNGAKNEEDVKLVKDIFEGGKNIIQCEDYESVPSAISGRYKEDFKIISDIKERPYVMHRVIGSRNIYALYNFPKESRCFFRAKGNIQLWDPWTGETSSIESFAKQTDEGTEVILPLTEKEIQIIVFGNEKNDNNNILTRNSTVNETILDDTWEFELKPSLDNQWGDYQLPVKSRILGAQVRQLNFSADSDYNGGEITRDNKWKKVSCGFGSQFLKSGPLPEIPSDEELANLKPENVINGINISGKMYKWEEYAFSWKQGVEGDYGHQGWHGLKGDIYDNFIRLGAEAYVKMSKFRVPETDGNYYLLYTNVIAPYEGSFDLLTGDIKPHALFVNNSKTDISRKTIKLNKGANSVLIVYNQACATYLTVRKPGVPVPQKLTISMRWYEDPGILPFDCSMKDDRNGVFSFESAPGLHSFTFAAHGKIAGVWINGTKSKAIAGQKLPDGSTNYSVNVKKPSPTSSQVALKIEYQQGYHGAGAIPQYFEQHCKKGSITTGDWSDIEGLTAYSGGAWYRKNISIGSMELNNRLDIDLGDLVSSAELFVNGQSAGIRLAPPWTFDITRFAKEGNNEIEVLIYNTIANNYTSIPTRYRGEIRSGLIGPVVLRTLKEHKQNTGN